MVLDFFRVVPKSRNVRIKNHKGLIFSNPSFLRRGLFYGANVLFLSALSFAIYLYLPLISAFYKYKYAKSETVIVNSPVVSENISSEYLIEIPKILAKSIVVENVSPFDQAEYNKILKDNVVAQTKGSAIPGSGLGTMTYIFAHSSNQGITQVRNNAVFYLLGEMQNGDTIYINYHGREIKYQVYDKKIVKAKELSYLEYKDQKKEILILQTCWPIGTNWQRLLIMAEKV